MRLGMVYSHICMVCRGVCMYLFMHVHVCMCIHAVCMCGMYLSAYMCYGYVNLHCVYMCLVYTVVR